MANPDKKKFKDLSTGKKIFVILFTIIVTFIFLIVFIINSATDAPEITYEQVMTNLEDNFSMEEGAKVNEFPRQVGQSNDDSMILEVTGNQNDIRSVGLIMLTDSLSGEQRAQNIEIFKQLIQNMCPNWNEARTWLTENISESKSDETYKDYRKVRLIVNDASITLIMSDREYYEEYEVAEQEESDNESGDHYKEYAFYTACQSLEAQYLSLGYNINVLCDYNNGNIHIECDELPNALQVANALYSDYRQELQDPNIKNPLIEAGIKEIRFIWGSILSNEYYVLKIE